MNSKVKPVPSLNLIAQHRALRGPLLQAFGRVLDSCRFVMGPEMEALEREVAQICSVRHGVAVNSGTDALLLALRALDIGPGDEVIVPDLTFMASGSVVGLVGARPVFVDVDPRTFTLDLDQVRSHLNRRTRAIIPVHLYGQMPDMTALMGLAHRSRVAVIEDAAQALAARWRGRPAGAWGDMACLSFYPTKNLGAVGDGGMVVTRQDRLAQRLRRLRDHGSPRKYWHEELGYNSRLDELQAAALRVKLPLLKAWNARRQSIARAYDQALAGSIITPPFVHPQAQHVYHQYTVRTPQRDVLKTFLSDRGIQTAVHYPFPLHMQPAFKLPQARQREFPVSQAAAREILCLPIAAEITDAQVRRVIAALRAFIRGQEKGAE